jgi:hypothetical protein
MVFSLQALWRVETVCNAKALFAANFTEKNLLGALRSGPVQGKH